MTTWILIILLKGTANMAGGYATVPIMSVPGFLDAPACQSAGKTLATQNPIAYNKNMVYFCAPTSTGVKK